MTDIGTFDSDGSGFAHYSSGALGGCVLKTSGGLQHVFYDEGTRLVSSAARFGGGGSSSGSGGAGSCGRVLCSFNEEGTGFAAYKSGKPYLSITHQGGTVSSETTGAILQEWVWEAHGRKVGLPKALELRLNTSLVIRVVDASDITVLFRGKPFAVGNKGLVIKKSAKEITQATGRPTLVQRFSRDASQDTAAMDAVHKNGWQLPRPSASGRETWKIADAVRPDLAPVIRGSRAVRERVRGQAMKSSITLRMEETHSSVGKATTGPLSGSTSASHVREGDDAGSHSDSPRARRKKPSPYEGIDSHYKGLSKTKPKPRDLLPVSVIYPKQLARIVASASRQEEEWRREKRRSGGTRPASRLSAAPAPAESTQSAPRPTSGKGSMAAKGAMGGKGGRAPAAAEPASEEPADDGGLAGAGGDEAETAGEVDSAEPRLGPLDEDFGQPYRVILCDCSATPTWVSATFACSTFPVYLAYYGGKLVFASTALSGRGATREVLLEQLAMSLDDAKRGRFLPEGFKFTSPRTVSLAALNAPRKRR